jgi:hypothetical protein
MARVMGTSVRMIERHYGTLLDGAGRGIALRLDAFNAGRGPSVATVEAFRPLSGHKIASERRTMP